MNEIVCLLGLTSIHEAYKVQSECQTLPIQNVPIVLYTVSNLPWQIGLVYRMENIMYMPYHPNKIPKHGNII